MSKITYTILTGTDCNCCCDYCYERNLRSNANVPLVLSTLDKAVKSLRDFDDMGLHFIGGETLMYTGMMNSLLEHSVSISDGRLISGSLVTNGTLIAERQDIQHFLQRWTDLLSFRLTISLDGVEEIHNRHRKLASGEGSWQKAMAGFRWCRDNLNAVLRTNSVITHESKDRFAEGAITLAEHGVKNIVFEADRYSKWTDEDAEILYEQFVKVIDYLVDKAPDVQIDRLCCAPEPTSFICKACMNNRVIGFDGELYPCHVLAAVKDKSFDMGEYFKQSLEHCGSCQYFTYCHRCPSVAWITRDTNPWYNLCGYTKALFRARQYFMSRQEAVSQ